jgi:hypothetical protein
MRRATVAARRLAVAPLTFALTFGPPAFAGSLAQPDAIDGVQLEASTRRLQLLVILDDDHVDSRPAMHALWVKLTRYQRYIVSGQALRDAAHGQTAANPSLRPEVVIVAPQQASSAEMQNLAGVKMAYDRRDIPVSIQPYVPGLHPRQPRDDP